MIERVKESKRYYYIAAKSPFACNANTLTIKQTYEMYLATDNINYESGNYFTTKEEAQKFLDEILDKFKQRTK